MGKSTCCQAWWPHFKLRDLHNGRRAPVPEFCPLTCEPWHECLEAHTYLEVQNQPINQYKNNTGHLLLGSNLSSIPLPLGDFYGHPVKVTHFQISLIPTPLFLDVQQQQHYVFLHMWLPFAMHTRLQVQWRQTRVCFALYYRPGAGSRPSTKQVSISTYWKNEWNNQFTSLARHSFTSL